MTMIDRRSLLIATFAIGATPLIARAASAAPDPMSKEAVLFDPEVPVLGNKDGDVTIVEFFDYQCPYCKQSHPDVVKLVREDGGIRHVMKDWPIFGPASLYASRLTLAAGAHHPKALAALMATPGRLTPQQVETTLTEAGFKIAALNAAYDADSYRINGILERNSAQAENFGLMGTPAYVVGTVLFPGVVAPADMKQAIAQARAG
ncbi:protein-disulfide isomerase [Aurantimonas endophytica]|uniref:Protein-disulfide isomerase n=2 Tax=Aurantimonas endophytica TaxID=1522175 RepID=A0A7W6HAB6_9HYPH|nr:protein-disulfide isomerase [Aurantimonas endophytica]